MDLEKAEDRTMTTSAAVKLLLLGTVALLSAGLAGVRTETLPPAGTPPQVTAFFRGTSGGMGIMVFYPDEKKLFMYKDDGTCDNSWTMGALGAQLNEDKCK